MRAPRMLLLVSLVLAASVAFAQSLLDDPGYRALINEVQQLKSAARQALDDGRYDESIALSGRAEEVARQAEAYAEDLVLAYRANGWMRLAREAVARAQGMRAADRYPDEWASAQRYLADAEQAFSDRRWTDAMAAARLVVRALENVRPEAVTTAPVTPPAPAAAPATTPAPTAAAEPVPPRYYVVRLIPERRDCFWRIAEYDFVYGDPWLWPVLYEANKHKIPEPDNPDLILPGMVVEIPSVAGERREGTWEPPQQ